MDNVVKHFTHQPILSVVFVVALVLVIICLRYFVSQHKKHGSAFEFASKPVKVVATASFFVLLGAGVYSLSPYVSPKGSEIAIVLGNTQNTPTPTITPEVSDAILETMLRHKGEDIEKLADSIKIVSAVKHPKVIDLNYSDMQLERIGNNTSNAKRSANANIDQIEEKLNTLQPTDNGANYLEAILEAADNVDEGSKIVVIGSGLSDSGDLNFSKLGILTNDDQRKESIQNIKDKYGSDFLKNYEVEFYGLGDTLKPQETLSNIQKGIVRDIYEAAVRHMGGNPKISTTTQVGGPVDTDYVVGTADTGCGAIGLVFDDNDLTFVGNEAGFIDKAAAYKSLATIQSTWVKYKDVIDSIKIDGYTAHYPGDGNLSQARANTVKNALVDMGVSPKIISAKGQGYGPYKEDAQNRIVKVNISRNNNQCSN